MRSGAQLVVRRVHKAAALEEQAQIAVVAPFVHGEAELCGGVQAHSGALAFADGEKRVLC